MSGSAPKIQSYTFGRITIGQNTYTDDVKIYSGKVKPDWWRKEGHSLCKEDIQDILNAKPDVLIVGQGAHGRMSVPPSIREQITQLGIELITQPTTKAWKTYNKIKDKQDVAAALHLTC